MSAGVGFEGVPLGAVDFYRELAGHNERDWWLANKDRYDRLVRDPFTALAAIVGPAFGETKV